MVSVIIPAYNAQDYIVETLASIYAQAYQDYEIIVVNDGSTDATAEIINNECLNNPKLRLISKMNEGVSIARNTGIAQAKGAYIAVLDADDTWKKDNLLKKVHFLDKHLEYGWVYCNLNCISEDSKFLREHTSGRDDDILNNILLWEGEVVPGPCSNIVYRTELAKQVAFDPSFTTAADQDFTLQLAHISKGKLLPERMVNYRLVEGSMSRNIAVMEKDHIGVFKKANSNHLFQSNSFRRKCFGNLYKILAGSWWKDGNSKIRGIKFIFKSLFTYPAIVKKYFS